MLARRSPRSRRRVTTGSATADPALLDLPWNLPLDVWPEDSIATLPKGISRHLVRFVNLVKNKNSMKIIGAKAM